jgi:hypothetical protein
MPDELTTRGEKRRKTFNFFFTEFARTILEKAEKDGLGQHPLFIYPPCWYDR